MTYVRGREVSERERERGREREREKGENLEKLSFAKFQIKCEFDCFFYCLLISLLPLNLLPVYYFIHFFEL